MAEHRAHWHPAPSAFQRTPSRHGEPGLGQLRGWLRTVSVPPREMCRHRGRRDGMPPAAVLGGEAEH